MDRRTFLMTGAWLSATGCAWPWMARAASARTTIAVVDASLVDASAFSVDAVRGAIQVFETGDDIGMLWYTKLAPRLRCNARPADRPDARFRSLRAWTTRVAFGPHD
jgi:hypothetical protein